MWNEAMNPDTDDDDANASWRATEAAYVRARVVNRAYHSAGRSARRDGERIFIAGDGDNV